MQEKTLVLIKPDGVCKGLIGEVTRRIEAEGFKIVGMKMVKPDREKFEEFYQPHKGNSFFPGLIDFMLTSPCVVMVAEGGRAIGKVREIIGERIPSEASNSSIRGKFGSDGRRNIVHGSDSKESARREIECFFSPQEIFSYDKDEWLNSEPG